MEESDAIILEWFSKRRLAENTRKGYKDSLNRYINFLNKDGETYTPEKLLKEAEEDEVSGKLLRYRRVNKHIIGFINHMEKRGNSAGTINNRIAAITSFYQTYNITTPFIPKKKGNTVLEKNQGPLLTRKEILKLIDVANLRDQTIIYTMSLTGLAQNEIRKLTIRKFADSIEKEVEKPINNLKELLDSEENIKDTILTLHLKREKANHLHFSFLPPEAHQRIFAYLKTRLESRNPKIHPDLDGLVFVNRYGDQLTTSGFAKIFTKLGETNKLSHQKGAFRKHRSHGLRKYFISTISNNIGDSALADYLVGHVPDRTSKSYNIPDEKKYLERYKKAYPFLSLDEAKIKDIETEGYKELNEKYEYLKGIMEMVIDPEINKSSEFMKGRKDILEFVEANKDNILKE